MNEYGQYSSYTNLLFEPDRWPKRGEKMKFTAKGGYEIEQNHAKEHFVLDELYTVRLVEIGMSNHKVFFEEVPGGWNGCLFSLCDCKD